jgi:hypothetical protein
MAFKARAEKASRKKRAGLKPLRQLLTAASRKIGGTSID